VVIDPKAADRVHGRNDFLPGLRVRLCVPAEALLPPLVRISLSDLPSGMRVDHLDLALDTPWVVLGFDSI
jgi:hypothetical protein